MTQQNILNSELSPNESSLYCLLVHTWQQIFWKWWNGTSNDMGWWVCVQERVKVTNVCLHSCSHFSFIQFPHVILKDPWALSGKCFFLSSWNGIMFLQTDCGKAWWVGPHFYTQFLNHSFSP